MKYIFILFFLLSTYTESTPSEATTLQPSTPSSDAERKQSLQKTEEALAPTTPNYFESYAGSLPEGIKELYRDWREPDETYKRLGCSKPRTAIIHGPEGAGKTVLIKCMARAIGARLFHIKHPTQMLNLAVSSPDISFQQLIKEDKFDAGGYKEGDLIIAYLPNAERLLPSKTPFTLCPYKLLINMVHNSPNTFLIAETCLTLGKNVFKRFDSIVPVELPTPTDRTAILTHYLNKTTVPKNLTAKNMRQTARYLSARLPDAAGADIAKIVAECIRTANASKKTVDEDALKASICKYKKLLTGSDELEASLMIS